MSAITVNVPPCPVCSGTVAYCIGKALFCVQCNAVRQPEKAARPKLPVGFSYIDEESK